MANVKDTELSAEGVTLDSQDQAASAQDDQAVEAVVEISELQHDGDFGEEVKLDEDTADEVGSIIADAVIAPDRPGQPLQDGLAFENARRDEAVAQGVEVTTQERLYELARQEEAQGQGVDHISETTHDKLFFEARAEEAHAEKLEQARHGPVEPLSITPHGVDQVKRDKELAKDTPAERKAAAQKLKEERGEIVSP